MGASSAEVADGHQLKLLTNVPSTKENYGGHLQDVNAQMAL